MHARAAQVPEMLQTSRLTAARIATRHHDALAALHADERVMVTMGGCPSAEQTATFIANSDQHWNTQGFGMYALHVRPDGAESGEFVGRAGLRRCVVGDADEVEVAYALGAPFWGQGLATEIATALVQIAFTSLMLEDLIAFALPHNEASRRVMEKIGMGYERDFVRCELPHVLYRLPRASFSMPT